MLASEPIEKEEYVESHPTQRNGFGEVPVLFGQILGLKLESRLTAIKRRKRLD